MTEPEIFITVAEVTYRLQVAPKALGESSGPWSKGEIEQETEEIPRFILLADASHEEDGLANTEAMAASGSVLAIWARGLDIEGHSDWYLPSKTELDLLRRAYAPGGDAAEEAFEPAWYWSSTEASDSEAWGQGFHRGGSAHCTGKDWDGRVRAVRRVATE